MLKWLRNLSKKKEPPAPPKAEWYCPNCCPTMNTKMKTVICWASLYNHPNKNHYCRACDQFLWREKVIPFNFKIEDGQIK